jgi:hypothetical protein
LDWKNPILRFVQPPRDAIIGADEVDDQRDAILVMLMMTKELASP